MKNNFKIGVIVADKDEFTPFEEFIKKDFYSEDFLFGRKMLTFSVGNAEVCALNCGIGKVNAAVAATALIDNGCNIILNYGLSGGIGNTIRGSIVVPEKFLEHDFDLTGIGYKPCEKPSQDYIYEADKNLVEIIKGIVGDCEGSMAVSGDHFVCSNKESAFLEKTFNAVTCDMETAAIAYTCNVSGIPFAAVRKISDNANDSAVDNYREMNSMSKAMPYEIIIELINEINNSNVFRS